MTEESLIAALVGFYPVEGQKIRSPFRNDKNPSCFFKRAWGWLRFFDPSYSHHNKANVYDIALITKEGRRIADHQPQRGKDFKVAMSVIDEITGTFKPKPTQTTTFTQTLLYEPLVLSQEIVDYYGAYSIEVSQLMEDHICGVKYYEFNSERYPNSFRRYYPKDLSIALNLNHGVKLYRPFNQNKWRTNLTRNDTWRFKRDMPFTVITGSHKDGRCAFNQGYDVWAWQSEASMPDFFEDRPYVYLGDNDEAGKRLAEVNVNRMRERGVDVVNCELPKGAKDVAAWAKKDKSVINEAVENARSKL